MWKLKVRVRAWDKKKKLVADHIFEDIKAACEFQDNMIAKGYNTTVEKVNV